MFIQSHDKYVNTRGNELPYNVQVHPNKIYMYCVCVHACVCVCVCV